MSETIKVGDRVKVEFEGIARGHSSTAIEVWQQGRFVGWFSREEVTVIPKPIVLPTGINALIALDGNKWVHRRVGKDEWANASGIYKTDKQVIDLIERTKGNYRLIFEGESE